MQKTLTDASIEVEDNIMKLQSINIKPRYEQLGTDKQHINDILQILNQSQDTIVAIKFPENSAFKFLNELKQNLNFESETCFFTSSQVEMIALMSRGDVNICNERIIVKQILIKLAKFVFTKENLSVNILREGIFKIVQFLRDDLKSIFQEEVFPEIIRQLKLFEQKGTTNSVESTAKNLFALMVLDDFVGADSFIISAMEQLYKKEISIAKIMIELICTQHAEILRQKLQKPLNLKVLFYKLEELGHSTKEYDFSVFDDLSQIIISANTDSQLINIIIENLNSIDEQKLALITHQLSNIKCDRKNIFKLISQKFEELKEDFNDSECLRQFIRGFGIQKQQIDQKTRKLVFEQVEKNIEKFSAEQCQSTLHKFVLFQFRDHNIIYLMVNQLCNNLKQIDMEALGKTLWSIGILGTKIDDDQFQIFKQKILELLEQFDDRTFTQVFQGLSDIFLYDGYLLNMLALKAIDFIQNSENIPIKTSVVIFGSLIKFNFFKSELFNLLYGNIISNIQDLKIQDFVFLMSAFGYVEKNVLLNNYQMCKIFQELVEQLENYYYKLNKAQLIIVFQGIAYSKYQINDGKNLIEKILSRLGNTKIMTPFQASYLLYAMAELYKKNLLFEKYQRFVYKFIQFIKKSEKTLGYNDQKQVENSLNILKIQVETTFKENIGINKIDRIVI